MWLIIDIVIAFHLFTGTMKQGIFEIGQLQGNNANPQNILLHLSVSAEKMFYLTLFNFQLLSALNDKRN
jgi:hypothetical protein